MHRFGVGLSKEDGLGSGLWAGIKRRHRRGRHEAEPDEDREVEPEILLMPRIDYRPLSDREPEPDAAEEPDPEIAPELESPPEPEVAPEPELEFAREPPEPEFAPEPVAGRVEAAALRAELDAARTDVSRLHDVLADAMTALAELSAEAAAEPYAAVE